MNRKDTMLVYAVDDEQSIREVYQYALENAGYEVRCFSSGEELLQAISARIPNIVLLDIMLDGADGYEILGEIRKNALTQGIPVIMVSAKGSEIDKVKGLNLGADDYLAKPFGVMELTARIHAHLRSRMSGMAPKLSYRDISIDETRHMITVRGEPLSLTKKEYDLLKLFVMHAEKVISRETLLDSVWGVNYGETRTLDIHIAQLRKLLAPSEAEIQTIRGVGYCLS